MPAGFESNLFRWFGAYVSLVLMSKLIVGFGSMTYYAAVSGASFEALEQFNEQFPAWLRRVYGFKKDTIPSFSETPGKGVAECILGSLFSLPFVVQAITEVCQSHSPAKRLAAGLFVLVELATLMYFFALGKKIETFERAHRVWLDEQFKPEKEV